MAGSIRSFWVIACKTKTKRLSWACNPCAGTICYCQTKRTMPQKAQELSISIDYQLWSENEIDSFLNQEHEERFHTQTGIQRRFLQMKNTCYIYEDKTSRSPKYVGMWEHFMRMSVEWINAHGLQDSPLNYFQTRPHFIVPITLNVKNDH